MLILGPNKFYNASILSMSPRREDGVGFKACLDESCLTPLDASYTYGNAFTVGYLKSKIFAEKAVLSYNGFDHGILEVVTLPCGLVGGETLLSYLPISVGAILLQLTGDLFSGNSLNLLQECIGLVPIAHVNDICQAHIFCMEQLSMRGRFCCAVSGLSIKEMAILTQGPQVGSKGDFSKLMKMGFEYEYGIKDILDDSVAWAKKLNGSSLSQVV
ncbi:putative anthocyanidin reductase ((2R,3R)-flavan-3-ol-forming) [Rosa chinensis]|uniref:Putative anthocyanidin reductase ((2R,3R)-flavan-3-ol-forming) n=1 Tax=Rosa chinensis TaxID=74649 RepID=A0A2P6P693_ROSCH|nr:putative anthocyanidin reductase ((2R,3R)-flavan-3-ol-forming) [Rosa chinensis]